jgi:hypothetical protein
MWKQQIGGLLIRGTMTKVIPLTQGKFALVDDRDYGYLSQWSWNACHSEADYYYAARTVKGRVIRMHREIMKPPKGMVVDHIDGNCLNNQRSNLRLVSIRENALNRKVNKNNKSGHRNVSWILGYWRVQLAVNGKNHIFPEKFDDPDRAGEFARQMRHKYYGQFEGNRS